MAKKRTTSEERKEFIEQMRERDSRALPRDMSFIDRRGNVVHPNQRDYEAAIKRRDEYDATKGRVTIFKPSSSRAEDAAQEVAKHISGIYQKALRKYNTQYNEAIKINKQYDNLIKKYGRSSEEVHEFEKEHGMRRYKRRGVEGTLAIIVLVAGMFFLSSNITGSVIGNLSQGRINILGVSLLLIGLIAGYFWIKK